MRIRSVRFGTADLEAAADYFGAVLDLPVERADGQLLVHAGWTELVIDGHDVAPGAQHLAFTIPRNQFAAAKSWLSARTDLLDADGVDEFECAPHWNARSFYFPGPDENVFEFIVRRDLPNDREGAFGGAGILGVSEVGIPADDVPAFEEQVRALGLAPYGQGGPTFRPLGDAEGLLIAVERGRSWFPTEHRAVEDRLEVGIEAGGVGEVAANGSAVIRAVQDAP